MPRYYEETALIEFIKQYTPTIEGETTLECVEVSIRHAPTADVVPMEEVFHEVDMFRKELMNTFIELCRGNDYNKLTLLKIGDTVDEIYANRISELKKKYT